MADEAYMSAVNAYTKQYTGPNNGNVGWAPEDPITADKMNNIEAGIVAAIKKADTAEGQVSTISSKAEQATTRANEAWNKADTAYNTADGLRDGASGGSYAWTAIKNATDQSLSTGALNNKFVKIIERISSLETIIDAAGQGHTDPETHLASMLRHFDDIDETNRTQNTSITAIQTEIQVARQTPADASETWRLVDNLDAIRALISTNIGDISDINTYITNTIDTGIDAIQRKIGYTDAETINANPTTNLKQIINTVKSDSQTYTDNKISAVNNHFTTLEERIDLIDGTDAGDNTIANRLSALEDEIDDANGNGTLNDRLDGIDNAIEALNGEGGSISSLLDRIEAIDGENGTVASLGTRISTLETEVGPAENSRIDAATSAITDIQGEIASAHRQNVQNDTLATRFAAIDEKIASLEAGSIGDASATKVIDDATFDENDQPILPEGEIASEDVDYLIKKGDKYYYWKYIDGEWNLISGGGSDDAHGTSSGTFVASLAAIDEPDVNVDYFVGTNATGYLHYRFIEIDEQLTPVLIGVDPDNIKRYNIDKIYDDTEKKNYLRLFEYNYGVANLINDELVDWKAETQYALGTQVIHEGTIYTCIEANTDTEWTAAHWQIMPDSRLLNTIELPEGGGGGSTAMIRVIRITPATTTTIKNDDRIYVRFFYSSVDATGESHEGTYVLKYNNGAVISSGNLNSGASDQQVTTGVWPEEPTTGFYQIDVTDYCSLGTQTFNLVVTTNGQEIPRAWTIEIKELKLESNAPDYMLIEAGNTVQFSYTPYGAMTKQLYVFVDGTQVGDPINIGAAVSGSVQECVIPGQTHGAHTISMYLKANMNGADIYTKTITRDYIWYDEDNMAQPIILASPYRGVPITAQQYADIEIPYSVYNRHNATSTVEYYDGNTLIDTVEVADNGVFHYVSETFGQKTLSIKVGNQQLDFSVTITELPKDVEQVSGAVINFDPSILSNNSANRLPTWTYNNQTYHLTVSDNFNWSNDASGGGYKNDVDGKCFVIKAGTWAEFDYKMFKQVVDNTDPNNTVIKNSVFENGAEMKIIFKVAAVRDASAIWFSNVGKPAADNNMSIGIQLNAHNGWLKTSEADAAEKQAALTGETASTNAYLYFPYSEEDKIELDININKSGSNEDFIMSYEDGVPSKAYSYKTEEILYQTPGSESVIRIGSPDCDVYIYKFRIYDKGLSTSEILRNFIADGKNITEKVNRYDRNSIYYDSDKAEGQKFTPYKTGNAVLDPEQLAKKMPDVKILMLECPTFTKSKKTFVKSSLRCIHADGGTSYPSRGDEDNWLFLDGYHSGQGTTSDNYGNSARNVDFLFMCDGTHAPTKKKNITGYEGYVSKLIKGTESSVFNKSTKSWEPTVNAEETICVDWKDHDNWAAAKAYEIDDLIRYGGQVYKCKEAHTSESPFDETKWELLPNYTNKVSLTSTSVPNNYFNLKVNVASSENVNNALFQKRFNDFLSYVYQSPAYKRDNKIKNDMEFVPAILFLRETDDHVDENGNYTNHLEFNDTEWHFYALGNIGDSKKTDYTRAYDPDDMNEFTVEISDNNTHNSQFQSGVYMSNNQRVVETSDSGINSMNYIWGITDEEWNAQRDPTEFEIDHDQRVANEEKYYADGVTEVEDLFPYILPNGKVYVNYRHRMLSAEPFDGDHSFEFRYACCGDYRDGDLINKTPGQNDDAQFDTNRAVVEAFYEWIIRASNEEFKNELAEWCVPEAVEYFYAFTHFYTMMDNRAKNCFWHFAKTGTHRQVHYTHPAMLHVYDELINGEYVRTEDTEIDPEKTYYTQYAFDLWAYDMDTAAGIDNNGELIFPYGKEDTDYRIAGVPSSGYVFNGAGSIIWRRLSSTFTNEIADIFNRVNEAFCFDANHLINEFDRFQNCYPEEMWRLDIERKYIRTFTGKVYDNCRLVNADGSSKQDTNYLKTKMQGRKKYQRRQWVRDQAIYFGSKYMLNNVRSNTIEVVCYTPDAPIWNTRGYEVKVDANTSTFRAFTTDDYVLYSPDENTERILYKCIEANQDQTFDPNKWVESVTPNYHLKIVPYQDMYINVAVGNGNLRSPKRAIAGQEYDIDCTSNMGETRVYIYAGSYIQALSNLASFYIGTNTFSNAARLKKLDLGTDNPYYHNPNFKTLTVLPNMPILEELNVKNCDSLSAGINLGASNNLRIVEAEGSAIPSITLPAYTKIETLHLPSTVNNLTLQAARALTSFYMKNKDTGLEDYTNLLNLNIVDSDYSNNINWLDIANNAINHLSVLFLRELRQSSVETFKDFDTILARRKALRTTDEDGNILDYVTLTGTAKVLGNWSEVEYNHYRKEFDYQLDFNTVGQQVRKWTIQYFDEDGETLLFEDYKLNDTEEDLLIDPVLENNPATNRPYITMPTKSSSPEYDYKFGYYDNDEYIPFSGWYNSDINTIVSGPQKVTGDMTLTAYFPTRKRRKYTVTWYDGAGTALLTSDEYEYGTDLSNLTPPNKDGIDAPVLPVTIGDEFNGYKVFKGWDRPVGTLTENLHVHPLWEESTLDFSNPNSITIDNLNDLNAADLYGITQIRQTSIRSNLLKDHLGSSVKFIQMGQDFDFDNDIVQSYNLIPSGQDVLRFSGGVRTIVTDTTSTAKDARTINNEVKIYDGGVHGGATLPAIYPLSSLENDFTLAIDFKFLLDNTLWSGFNTEEYVIASCYKKYNGAYNGFKIALDGSTSGTTHPTIKITWGDGTTNNVTYIRIDNLYHSGTNFTGYRNMIVLRHNKTQKNSLFVYYLSPTPDPNMYSNVVTANPKFYNVSGGVTSATLTWNSSLTVDTPLVLGGIYSTDPAEIVTNTTIAAYSDEWPAKGVIYYAKYWEADLGSGNCSKLAAWTHQTMGFKIMGYDDGLEVNDTNNKIIVGNRNILKINFTAAQGLGDRYCDYKRSYSTCFSGDDSSVSGWSNFDVRTFMQNTVYNAFPVVYQSLIKTVPIQSKVQTVVNANTAPTYTNVTLNDNIYMPSFYEIMLDHKSGNAAYENADADLSTYSSEVAHQWPWINAGSVKRLYGLDTSNNFAKLTATHANYLRLLFLEHSITPESHIFNMTNTNPYTLLSTSPHVIEGETIRVNPGDIWYTGATAYMYVDADDVANGAPIVEGLDAAEGCGWIESCIWATRTFEANGASQRSYAFLKTMKNGQVMRESQVDITTTLIRALVPQFSI